MAFLDRLQTLGKKLKDSKLPELAGVILGETPIGKVGRIIKGAAEILGTDADPDAIAEALEGATPEQRAALLELTVREREAEEKTEREIQRQTTARHAADILSDSALSKATRPTLCIGLVAASVAYSYAILLFVVLGQIFGLSLNLGDFAKELIMHSVTALWTATGGALAFYFGGRTAEKRGSFFAAASRD
jgi:hypothetical protein